ncbi:ArsR family transcriptional regulator [Streptococcus pneumoniae]|nr:ArsR family transcriptional regulator [Streptococcus pneumoniae]
MEPDIFIITKLLSDPSRMHILDILMDGKAHTVNEIASFTKIKQHTVSYHLKLLTEAQVTTLQTYGRFHYYSLKSAAIAEMLEFLSFYSPQRDVKSYKQHIHKKELKVARTCYDHIAGELGISITNYLLQENLLSESEKDFQLTEAGKSYFQRKLHIDTDELNPNFKLKLATQKKFTWRLVVQAFFRVVVNPIFDKSYFFRSRFLGSFR